MASSSLNYGGPKKHGFSLGRFSLRRLLNATALGRTVGSGSKARTVRDYHLEDTLKPEAYNPPIDVESSGNSDTNSVHFNYTHAGSSLSPGTVTSNLKSKSPASIIGAMASPGSASAATSLECPLCLLELPLDCFPSLTTCSHRACHSCLQQYLKIEISESRINISCPECTEPIHPNDIKAILADENYITKYENFMLRRVLVTEPDARWCPAPDCDYVVIASGCASCPKLRCCRPGCETSFCYHCKQEWHPNLTCDSARIMRNKDQQLHQSYRARLSSLTSSHDSIRPRDDVKPCPSCRVSIIKIDDGSCNHMTCSVCGAEFCWLCMKRIGDLHFLSPSGCTFWGKKPWSRKKKIMWQLGMLVGAPVGIALIAGIAVPAIIIGVPVWVGRTLHARFAKQSMNQHKKNLLVTSGVVTSVLISPILTAVAIGIGVPILLAYVYGVVPISLCRSGGCGITTSSSGVRFDLNDEEIEIELASATFAPDGLSVDTAVSNKGVNPSIGEVSFGLSTSLSIGGSGCHLDKMSIDRDASNAALAGSITGSSKMQETLSMGGPSSNKRFSVTSSEHQSETASNTISFSERCSTNLSLGDDASTKALAGSIVGYKDVCIGTTPNGVNAVTPVEIHVIESETIHCIGKSCLCEDALSTKSAKMSGETKNHSDMGASSSDNNGNGSKCVSFQPVGSKGKLNKYESRSCEQLANYCIICDQIHRPCCPAYVVKLSMQTNEQRQSTSPANQTSSSLSASKMTTTSIANTSLSPATSSSSSNSKDYSSMNSPLSDQTFTMSPSCSSFSSYSYPNQPQRKESIKSTTSDTTPNQGKMFERLKSFERSKNFSKNIDSTKLASLPNSPSSIGNM